MPGRLVIKDKRLAACGGRLVVSGADGAPCVCGGGGACEACFDCGLGFPNPFSSSFVVGLSGGTGVLTSRAEILANSINATASGRALGVLYEHSDSFDVLQLDTSPERHSAVVERAASSGSSACDHRGTSAQSAATRFVNSQSTTPFVTRRVRGSSAIGFDGVEGVTFGDAASRPGQFASEPGTYTGPASSGLTGRTTVVHSGDRPPDNQIVLVSGIDLTGNIFIVVDPVGAPNETAVSYAPRAVARVYSWPGGHYLIAFSTNTIDTQVDEDGQGTAPHPQLSASVTSVGGVSGAYGGLFEASFSFTSSNTLNTFDQQSSATVSVSATVRRSVNEEACICGAPPLLAPGSTL